MGCLMLFKNIVHSPSIRAQKSPAFEVALFLAAVQLVMHLLFQH